ncbi:PREDICTED: ovochymase-1-like [Gekko japonicus]|uniref:Ovochymase-1-like n=1 Tax=Gekko japonicus TaxID=146911 RepID=A0ABM1JRW2_GEKJA|nr:PREDICTED: ovochymase-1-like [Gekko japonicus]
MLAELKFKVERGGGLPSERSKILNKRRKSFKRKQRMSGLKCGVRSSELESEEDFLEAGLFSRIIGGRDPAPGRQLWQVSIKLGLSHFCGGSLIHENMVVTAAHCVVNLLNPELAKNLIVTVGEFDLRRTDKGEQNIPVLKIILHPAFSRFGHMNSDIALLYLKYRVKYGHEVQPICLPHKEDTFEEGMLCVVSGWGKVSEVPEPSHLLPTSLEDCSSHGMLIFGESGHIRHSCLMGDHYLDNSRCSWNITVPEDKFVLVQFITVDIEDQVGCDQDYVNVHSSEGKLIGKVCGHVLPSPLLIDSDQATVTFVSDSSQTGGGFEFLFTAVHKASEAGSGCGSVAVLVEEGEIDTANYPGLYPSHSKCHWLIEAPTDHVIKLEFEDFAVEVSQGCIYDAVTVFDDTEEEHQLALLCGFSVPSPVWSSGNILLIHFQSDGENNFRGFKARFTFSPSESSKAEFVGLVTSESLYWTVVAGDHDRLLKEPAEQIRRVKTILIHSDFDVTSYDSDIALVQLEAPLSYSAAVQPICLPNYTEPLFDSLLCTVTGCGGIQEAGGPAGRLQQTQVPMLNNNVCDQNYYFNHPRGITPRMLCAGFAFFRGQDPCRGDSGGPLVCQNEDSSFTLYGIVSWGVGCARPKKAGVYTRVSIFLDWILSRMKEKGPAGIRINNTGRETLVGPPESFMNLSGAPYGQEHTGEVRCLWVLRISPGGMAKMTLKHLWIPESEHCKVEFFAIYEESRKGRGAKLCGSLQSPMSFLSQGPVVKVELHSTIRDAFATNYVVLRVPGSKMGESVEYSNNLSQQLADCRDAIPTTQEGVIQSPGFPNAYANTICCRWRIVSPLNSVIRLDFIDFTSENPLPECRGGLSIYEGFESAKEVLGNFCDGAPRFPLKSHGPVVMLTFNSGTATVMKGFVLAYRIHEIQHRCPILDLIPVGIAEITSPNYPHTYPSLLTCTWTVYSASGKRLKAVIKDLETEDIPGTVSGTP